jgi:sugar phosphate isomerase/epimerase
MNLKYVCTYWGQEELNAVDFFAKVLNEGYDGIEINFPDSSEFTGDFLKELARVRNKRKDFVFIAQQVLESANESVDEYIKRMSGRLNKLAKLNPDFINSHTGKDYFYFDDNCRVIKTVLNISDKTGIRILHETHRGRFSFHAFTLLKYLEKFPEMELTGDISHWCNVSESMLGDQQDVLQKIIPHISHIHARIGFEHSPQVNDPFAPEWKNYVDSFMKWWKEIITQKEKKGADTFTICPEFGPAPYMPALPFTQQPIGNQWKINVAMKDLLKKQFD